jgi:hypothetical protein
MTSLCDREVEPNFHGQSKLNPAAVRDSATHSAVRPFHSSRCVQDAGVSCRCRWGLLATSDARLSERPSLAAAHHVEGRATQCFGVKLWNCIPPM